MKNYLKTNWKKILISCLLTLAPIVVGLILWNTLPETMNIHWGADGVADGTGSKAFAVFALPAILLAVNLLCFVATVLDKKNQAKNQKAMGVVFWIMPVISWGVNGAMYAIAMGKNWSFDLFMPLLFGLLFVVLGNMLPKVSQNKTYGIKMFWTLYNEENWNKTHRIAGKLWVGGGLLCLLTAFLPTKAMIAATLVITLVMILIPVVYSYSIYKKHRKAGIDYEIPAKDKKLTAAVIVPIVVILGFVGIVMFTGDITVTSENSAICITADYYEDLTVPFEAVTEISYRENLNKGSRAMGFGSARLSMGVFQNEEFGTYTLYAYTGCEAAIVIRGEDKVLVVNCKTPAETEALYESLLAQMK